MFGRLSHTRLLRYAGLFTWAMVGVPLVYSQYVPADGGEELASLGARARRRLGRRARHPARPAAGRRRMAVS